MNVLDEVAAVFFFLEDYTMQFLDNTKFSELDGVFPEWDDFETARMAYSNFVNELDNKPWNDGQHCGDCTNVPFTCTRCLVEGYREPAQKWLREFTGDHYE